MEYNRIIELRKTQPNKDIYLVNKDSTKESCNILYFPILESGRKKYKEPRVLIQIPIKNGFDFREVPHFYLKEN